MKICGITNLADARHAARSGADYLGYILFSKSPRYIAPPHIREITNLLRIEFPHVLHVGVFVNTAAESVCNTVELAGLDFAQLHGSESPDLCSTLHQSGIRHLKAFRFGKGAPVSHWDHFTTPHYYLCDTYDPVEAGGTGRPFDHTLLPTDLPRQRMFLAGGLTPENVAEAIHEVTPFAVDVSSGVEQSPGIKSPEKVAVFIRRAKGRAT